MGSERAAALRPTGIELRQKWGNMIRAAAQPRRLRLGAALAVLAGSLLLLLGLSSSPSKASSCIAPPSNISSPTISGGNTPGSVLTGSVGTWDNGGCPSVTYTVSWYRDSTGSTNNRLQGPTTLAS